MPYGIVLKDKRRTSNVQRRMKNEYPIPNIQRLFLFLFSPSTSLRAVSLSNGRFDTRNENLN